MDDNKQRIEKRPAFIRVELPTGESRIVTEEVDMLVTDLTDVEPLASGQTISVTWRLTDTGVEPKAG